MPQSTERRQMSVARRELLLNTLPRSCLTRPRSGDTADRLPHAPPLSNFQRSEQVSRKTENMDSEHQKPTHSALSGQAQMGTGLISDTLPFCNFKCISKYASAERVRERYTGAIKAKAETMKEEMEKYMHVM